MMSRIDEIRKQHEALDMQAQLIAALDPQFAAIHQDRAYLLGRVAGLEIVTAQCRLAQQHSYDAQCIAERNEEKANALLDEMRSAWAAGIQYDNWRANYESH